ncbi:MAG: MATE family efflux transporter, partial [Planctomycetales bacterium]|nr:MATE family efflux transporter [Planctomycetales bacterium]
LDAGLSVAIQYFVAHRSDPNQRDELTSFYSSAYACYAIAAVVATIIGLLISWNFPHIFPKFPHEIAVESSNAMAWASLGMGLFFLNVPCQGVLMGMQRHYICNTVEVCALVTQMVVVIATFEFLEPNLRNLAFGFTSLATVRFVLYHAAVRTQIGIRITLSTLKWETLSQIFSFGGHSAFWTIATGILKESGPSLAAVVLGPRASTAVFVGTKVVRSVGVFIQNSGSVLMPMAATLAQADDQPRIRAMILKGTRFCALLSFAGAGVLVAFCDPLLAHWLGNKGDLARGVVIVTALGMLGSWVTQAQLSLLIGTRTLWPLTYMMGLRVILFVVLGVALGWAFGTTGLALGIVLPNTLTSVTVLPWLCARRFNVRLSEIAATLTYPLIIGLVVTVASMVLQHLWPPTSVGALATEAIAAFVLFVVLAYLIGIDSQYRSLINKNVSAILHRQRPETTRNSS